MYWRTPSFWRTRGFVSELLVPFSVFQFLAMRLRDLIAWGGGARRLPVPVFCVGNATAGGAGKTPVALAIGKILSLHGMPFAFLSRGYGGTLRGPIQVNPNTHTAEEVGDEPLLLAGVAPCWVARNRRAGAEAAIAAGTRLLVLDDGLQDRAFPKDMALLVVDGSYGFGNGLLIPAGPLRDRMDKTLARATAAVIIGEDISGAAALLEGLPILQASLSPLSSPPSLCELRRTGREKVREEYDRHQPSPLPSPVGRGGSKASEISYVAFAGIGRPEKFFATLREAGFTIKKTIPFPDHYAYSDKDADALLQAAVAEEATLITTEKDAVRLPPSLRDKVARLPVEIIWKQPGQIQRLLAPYLTP